MAATASRSRQPHDVPMPQTPGTASKQQKVATMKKGKGKAKEQPSAPKRRTQIPPSAPPSGPALDWATLTDSSACNVPPVFTKDGNYFFSLVGSSVHIYASVTGKIVSTLSIPRPAGHDTSSDAMTCAVLNPHNAFQLITGSSAGILALWDILDAKLLQAIDITQPIHHICVHETQKDSVFVTASRPSKKSGSDDNGVVLRVSLKPTDAASQSTSQKSSEITPIGKIRHPTGLAFSPRGDWLVATAGHKSYVASMGSVQAGFTKYVSPERLTCLAFHPTEDYFATGDEKGNIRLWYYLNHHSEATGVEKKAQTSSFHWHAHAVSSLAFTPNGAYLLSGGEEAVLVIWQLHSGKRDFLPRVGSPIKTISVSHNANGEEEYLLGLADATYSFVGASSLKINRSYSRLKLDPSTVYGLASSSRQTPLAIHKATSSIILPSSHPSSLQFYSPGTKTVLSELEVSPSNRVSRRDDKPIEPARVDRVVLSPSGKWLATVDAREGDQDIHGESYLKLWRWDKATGHWILNTRIDRPHGLGRVSGVAFSSASEAQSILLVSTGEDNNVKTWRVQTVQSKAGPAEEFWIARSSVSVQDESPSHVSWSPDASLFAVTHPSRVALFNAATNLLMLSISLPECGTLEAAYFLGSTGRYLAIVGPSDVVLWDLVEQRVRWHRKSSNVIMALVPHPRDDSFAVVERNQSQVLLFHAASAQPTRTLNLPFILRNVVWYPFVSSFSLVAITEDWRLILIGENVRSATEESTLSKEMAVERGPERRSIFEDVFGTSFSQTVPSKPSASMSTAQPWTGKEGRKVFDNVAYMLPPLEDVFDSLMDGFLKPRTDQVEAAAPVEVTAEDVEMEGPEVVTVGSPREVDDEEMSVMVDLFKRHTLKAQALRVPAAVNGTVNGHTKPVRPAASTPKAKAQSINGAAPAPSSPAPSSTPVVNGRKRKKSMG
ncbi:unnamed protein product [Mycena citricolor]|uniref:WD repeat-containing protein 75 second beta-propeller domain-containing protein n=1 Tax=Mycena citricolor TaxID=2018698 RepID=A0AAD2K5N4_9AGAR|nr:unnamed protein product [Mycena citricolor]